MSRLTATHELHTDVKITAYDGKAAYDMTEKQTTITTPNADWVPVVPSVDPVKGIHVRSDGLLGGQEFSRWPQFHTKLTLHHSTIPFRFKSTDSIEGDDVIWYTPKESDTVLHSEEEDSLGQAVELFRKPYVDALMRAFELTVVNTQRTYASTGEKDLNRLIIELERRGRGCLDRMRTVASGWFFNLSAFREVQRAILELLGIQTYAEVVVPRLRSNQLSPFSLLRVRGAFTRDPAVVLTFFDLGIPVWYLRPSSSITQDTKIFSVVSSTTDWTVFDYLSREQFLINGDAKRPILGKYQISDDLRSISDNIWSDDGMRQLLATIRSEGKTPSTNHATFSLPLGDVSGLMRRVEPPAVRSPSPPAQTGAGRRKGVRKQDRSRIHYELNRPRSQHFFVPRNPIDGETDCPPHRPTLSSILYSIGEVEKDSNIPVFYAMPPSFLLVHSEIDKTVKNYHNYLNIRTALLRILVRGGNFSPIFRRIGEWSGILVGNYRKSEPVALAFTTEPVARLYDTLDTRPASRRDKRPESETRPAKKAKRASLSAMKVTFGSELQLPSYTPDIRPEWRGRSITPEMIRSERELRQEIQWELNEISFRVEFCALDNLIMSQTRLLSEEQLQDHRDRIREIFLCSSSTSKFSFFPDIAEGVVEYWKEERSDLMSIQALIDVLQGWPLYPRNQLPGDIPNDQTDVKKFLNILLKFYVETFITHFSRVPALPCIPPPSLIRQ